MKIDVVRRVAWAAAICIGPLAVVGALLSTPRHYSYGRYVKNGFDSTDIERAFQTGFVWMLLTIPLIVLVYYACKYILTGHLKNNTEPPSAPS